MPTPRLCALHSCGADISHKRRGTLFCSDACRKKAAYADSEAHKAAEERREARQPAKLASIDRMEKRRWAAEKRQRRKAQDDRLADPCGFRAYEASRPKLTAEELLERLGHSAIAGLVQDAFMDLGIHGYNVYSHGDGGLGFMADAEIAEYDDYMDDLFGRSRF